MATEQKEQAKEGQNGHDKPKLDADAERKRLDALNDPKRGQGEPVGAKKEKEEKPPDPMRVLAKRAVEIAEASGHKLGSAITAPQASLIKERLGKSPGEKFQPASLQQLQNYAQGGKGLGREEIPGEAVVKLRDFCKATESRRIWPRKVAAMVLALEEERTGHVRAHTKVHKETK